MGDEKKLHILLGEDLVIRGGAQIWLAETARRLVARGHTVTVFGPSDSFVVQDAKERGVQVLEYDREGVAGDAYEGVKEQLTAALKTVHAAVVLVRQQRGRFQNVRFVAEAIAEGGLHTFLIAKTGTIDETYSREFYGGPLLDMTGRCLTVCIAAYTRDYIVEHYKIAPELVRCIYNGTEIERFKNTPEQLEEALRRYPFPEGSGPIVGCVGSYEPRKGQVVLLDAAKILIESGRLPHLQILFIGEGPDKQLILDKIAEFGLTNNVALYDFTKEPNYVFERIDLLALPSFKEGLPNVLLEALAMRVPCVSSRIMGCPEVVIDGETGFCFEAGNAQELADRIVDVWEDKPRYEKMRDNGKQLIISEHSKLVQFEKILELIVEKAANVEV